VSTCRGSTRLFCSANAVQEGGFSKNFSLSRSLGAHSGCPPEIDPPRRCTIELDISEAPDAGHVCTLGVTGGFIDLIHSCEDGDKTVEFAEKISRETGLPLTKRYDLW
jgi:hypothetical protein